MRDDGPWSTAAGVTKCWAVARPTLRGSAIVTVLVVVVTLIGLGGPSSAAAGQRSPRQLMTLREAALAAPVAPSVVEVGELRRPTAAVHPMLATPFRPQSVTAFSQAMPAVHTGRTGRRHGVVSLSARGGTESPKIPASVAPLETLTTAPAMSLDQQVATFGGDQDLQPPDTIVAVGPSAVAEMVNSSGSVWTKSGSLLKAFDLNAFYRVPSGYRFTDPRILYDAPSGRFFASGLAFDSAFDSQIYVAVSSTSDPAGSWMTYVVTSNTSSVLADQPKLGVNDDKVVLSWNDYPDGLGFGGQETWVVQKSDLLAGVSIRLENFPVDPTRFGIVPVQSLTATSTEFAVYNLGSSLGLVALSGTPAQGNVTSSETDLAIAATSVPPQAQQPSGPLVDTNDQRLLSATWRSGVLWTGANDGCVPAGDSTTRSCLRLIQVDTGSATIGQDFDIGQNGGYLYFPAPAVDNAGNLFVGFTQSSASQDPSAELLGEAAGSATFQEATIAGGLGPYCVGCGNARWGDYSGIAVDPSTASDVWAADEYVASGSDSGDWGTAFGRFTFAAPTVTALSPSGGTVNGGTTVTVSGADFVRGATTISFGATAATGVTVQSPTQLTATAPAGARGAVDVTITTAAGTSATGPTDQFSYFTTPGAPSGVNAAAGYQQAAVSWAPPADNGGTAVTSYTVTASGPAAPPPVQVPSTSTVETGLTSGDSYTFTVTAANPAGTGPTSAPSNAVVPYTLPGPPSGVAATAGDHQATVSWASPASDGGKLIVSYTVTSSSGGVAITTAAHAVTVGGLTNGTAYTFTVVATNQAGSGPPSPPSTSVTPMAPQGYWLVASDGGIFGFGAPFYGSTGGIHLNQPIVAMTGDLATGGYWLVARDGGIFGFGAPFYGSTGGTHLNQPIVGMTATPSGHGYWLVASDGGIFAFGDATFRGSTGGTHLNQPIVGMTATATGHGYWLVASDGGIFAFGDATFRGSTGGTHLNQSIVGMSATATGHGYWLVASDGGIFAFGDATFRGSTGGTHLNQPIVAVARRT